MTTNQQTLQHMRNYLWNLLQTGDFHERPGVLATVEMALKSTEQDWILDVFNWARIQDIPARQEQAQGNEEIWREPPAESLRGEVFIGHTIASGHQVWIPRESFGYRGHLAAYGASGTGKSSLLNFICTQLISADIPTLTFDSLNQSAVVRVPTAPAGKLLLVDYPDYRCNFLCGSQDQIQWIRSASDHLMDSLDIELVTMNLLIRMCEEIVRSGDIAAVPSLLAELEKPQHRSMSHRALRNRLLPLVIGGQRVFDCEAGFDLRQMLARSVILNLKGTPLSHRKLIINDLYFYFNQTREILPKWKLRNVFFIHEAGSLISRAISNDSSYMLRIICEARNYGIGLVLADQTPHLEHPAIKSNIGTRCIFRLEDQTGVEMFKVSLGLNEKQRHSIMNLPDRHMILRRPDIPFPFLVRVPSLF